MLMAQAIAVALVKLPRGPPRPREPGRNEYDAIDCAPYAAPSAGLDGCERPMV
jgi:hypothetical protein